MLFIIITTTTHTHNKPVYDIYTTCTHNIIIIQRRTYITHINMLFLFLSYIFYSPLLIGSGAWKQLLAAAAVRRMVGLIERFSVSKCRSEKVTGINKNSGTAMMQQQHTKKKKKKKNGKRKHVSNWDMLKSSIAPSTHRKKRKRKEETTTISTIEKVQIKANDSNHLVKILRDFPQFEGQDKIFALDCEMVGLGVEDRSILARATVVNGVGDVVFDKHVRPPKGANMINYRTHVSGIRPKDIKWNSSAVDFKAAQCEVAAIIENSVVVGHSLKNDFHALMLTHPPHLTRDTARFKPLLRARKQGSFKVKHRPQKLKKLTQEVLGVEIQEGEHDSADDARAALALYYKFRKEWEIHCKKRYRKKLSR